MKVATVVGARPQFIKAAPVSRALRSVADEYLIHTGQHYDEGMSKVFFEDLDIPAPAVNLGVGSNLHGAQTAAMLTGLEAVFIEQRPDWVMVYGDTNSTLAGALAAAKLHLPVAHVEAGLRSFRRDMPEEINRVLTDHLADHLYCPTRTAVDHLAAEGIEEGVYLVGDVMVDALLGVKPLLDRDRLRRLNLPDSYVAVTLHRAENVDDRDRLAAALVVLAELPHQVVFPVHPRTARALERAELDLPPNVRMTDPLGYVDMLALVAHAEAVLTDSGGLQKESVLLGVRCVTLRDETEWPETLAHGWNTVAGLRPDKVLAALEVPIPIKPVAGFGDGTAALEIAKLLER
jgi:UDP-N-acetylglucosamine 2-epimerase